MYTFNKSDKTLEQCHLMPCRIEYSGTTTNAAE